MLLLCCKNIASPLFSSSTFCPSYFAQALEAFYTQILSQLGHNQGNSLEEHCAIVLHSSWSILEVTCILYLVLRICISLVSSPQSILWRDQRIEVFLLSFVNGLTFFFKVFCRDCWTFISRLTIFCRSRFVAGFPSKDISPGVSFLQFFNSAISFLPS